MECGVSRERTTQRLLDWERFYAVTNIRYSIEIEYSRLTHGVLCVIDLLPFLSELGNDEEYQCTWRVGWAALTVDSSASRTPFH